MIHPYDAIARSWRAEVAKQLALSRWWGFARLGQLIGSDDRRISDRVAQIVFTGEAPQLVYSSLEDRR